jgi:hypothetical protein
LLATAAILFFLAQDTPTEKEEKNKHQRRFSEIEEQKADVVAQDALITKSEIAVHDIFW